MKCLLKYQWVKLMRSHLPQGKGVMGSWARLASRAAFRKGTASYCGYSNPVTPGMWSGGIIGKIHMLKHDVVFFGMYITTTPVYFRYIVNLVSMVNGAAHNAKTCHCASCRLDL